jgi:hypothetical protein
MIGRNDNHGTRKSRRQRFDQVSPRTELYHRQRLAFERTQDLATVKWPALESGGDRFADAENVPFLVMDDRERADELSNAANSGLMDLTGQSAGPALEPPPGLVRGLDRLVDSVARWSTEIGETVRLDWGRLLTSRARLMGLRRQGRTSPNGSCRLMRAVDGWVAINLPRPEDRRAVPALLESDVKGDPWHALENAIPRGPVSRFVDRARLLGVPAAPLGHPEKPGAPWSEQRISDARPLRALSSLRVVDLSSMWAGPLAAKILAQCGARVVKVESTSRPDGARTVPTFYGTLHPEDQEVVTLDFHSPAGREHLGMLLADADVVVESSRPRALEQLGLSCDMVHARPGKVWASITGYGRTAPGRDWAAFGDDAAVAAGMVAWEGENLPVFCGDAIADPIAGMTAGSAILQAIANGGGFVLDVSMKASAASLLGACDSDHADRCTTRPATTVATTESG